MSSNDPSDAVTNSSQEPATKRQDGSQSGVGRTSETNRFTPASKADASGYGLSLTIIGGVLLALSYYGYAAITGPQTFGQAVPAPFYLLIGALLFALELFRTAKGGMVAIAQAVTFAIFYGGLAAFAIEGGSYLWNNPDAALDGFVGITVLAVSFVVSALAYFVYLSVIDTSPRTAR